MIKLNISSDLNFLRVVEGDELEVQQLKLSLRKQPKNFKFNPLYKRKIWDGYIKFMDDYLRTPVGLWNVIYDIGKKHNFEIQINGLDELRNKDFVFDKEDFLKWEIDFFKDSEKQPRDYQIDSAIKILEYKRSISEIATSAGKTLIIFMIFAYLKKIGFLKRMLIIVPNVQLVVQTLNKFEEYSGDKTKLKYTAQMIGGGEDKLKKNVDIVVGTYQTLRTLNDDFYNEINALCVDEAHTAKTESLKTILKKCLHINLKFGMSGTLMNNTKEEATHYTILSYIGPLINEVTPDFLFKHGFASKVNIKMLYLDYLDDETRLQLEQLKKKAAFDKTKLFKLERDIIKNSETRFNYIIDIISSIKNNSLILFADVKNRYGSKIHDRLKETLGNDFNIYYVDGSVSKSNREYYVDMINQNTDKTTIIVASYGCFSTGIDIQNLHNIFLVESYKSEVIIKQSFGRGMRLYDGKEKINIIDFVDDFSIGNYQNYTLIHSYEREKIYKSEKFIYKKFKIEF